MISCGRKGPGDEKDIITVSIAPFKFFVSSIAGDDFTVNVMVPAGANPHIYEPVPEQINKLSRSVAFVSNGYLGFELAWLDRFYEVNKEMKRVSLGDNIDLIEAGHHHEGEHSEGADPHYWVSPGNALIIAASVRDLLVNLSPGESGKYERNYLELVTKINEADKRAREIFSGPGNKSFMIFHPNLAYLARDYGLEEIAVEFEGKEPDPSRLKYLIDRARAENLNTILVQREYDTKNARAIAGETGAKVVIIDPLSEDWLKSTMEIINILGESFVKSGN